MNIDLFAFNNDAERRVHHMAIWVQTHCGCKEQRSVTGIAVEKVSVVVVRVARCRMSNRLRCLVNREVVVRGDHDCDRSHLQVVGTNGTVNP